LGIRIFFLEKTIAPSLWKLNGLSLIKFNNYQTVWFIHHLEKKVETVMVNNSTISTKRTTTSDLSSLNNKKDHDI
jgi:hypothetical protein